MKSAPEVFKFGGASVKNAKAIQNVAGIIRSCRQGKLLVVVSAMDNTTNILEQIVSQAQSGKSFEQNLEHLRNIHLAVSAELFGKSHRVNEELENLFVQLREQATRNGSYDQVYDQTVSLGEVISSLILGHYLNSIEVASKWIDARQYIRTDSNFREGRIDWDLTAQQIQPLNSILQNQVIVTQGFIGTDPQGLTTTLGREGSDFSAAIFASCLPAHSVTIWKDVPGVMNADPKRLSRPVVFEALPFKEAAEMTYYGASIIHPKTIKPLANKNIPLYVKSFVDPDQPGTAIHEFKIERLPPLIIYKENQCLVSCRVTDYSFITEHEIGVIFQTLSARGIKINVMQSSAISFTFCVDFVESKILNLIDALSKEFEVFYNTGLTLITVKNYDAKLYQEYRNMPGVILEQSSRSTLQVLLKS